MGILLEIATSPATTSAEAIDFTWLFIKMMGALLVVCLLAVVILKYAVPRMGIVKKYAGGKYISIVARHSLDHKKALYVVRVGSKHALLGASDQGVNLIMELKKEDVEPN